jgi:hypothetical protein
MDQPDSVITNLNQISTHPNYGNQNNQAQNGNYLKTNQSNSELSRDNILGSQSIADNANKTSKRPKSKPRFMFVCV